MGTEYTYETLIGRWVTERCKARADRHPGKVVPDYVRMFLDGIDWNPEPTAKEAEASGRVLAWLGKTIIDPDWPEL